MTPLDSILAGTASLSDWLAFAGSAVLTLGLLIGGIMALIAHVRSRYDDLDNGRKPKDWP